VLRPAPAESRTCCRRAFAAVRIAGRLRSRTRPAANARRTRGGEAAEGKGAVPQVRAKAAGTGDPEAEAGRADAPGIRASASVRERGSPPQEADAVRFGDMGLSNRSRKSEITGLSNTL